MRGHASRTKGVIYGEPCREVSGSLEPQEELHESISGDSEEDFESLEEASSAAHDETGSEEYEEAER